MRLTRATRHAIHQEVVAGTLSNACDAVDSGRRAKRFRRLHSANMSCLALLRRIGRNDIVVHGYVAASEEATK